MIFEIFQFTVLLFFLYSILDNYVFPVIQELVNLYYLDKKRIKDNIAKCLSKDSLNDFKKEFQSSITFSADIHNWIAFSKEKKMAKSLENEQLLKNYQSWREIRNLGLVKRIEAEKKFKELEVLIEQKIINMSDVDKHKIFLDLANLSKKGFVQRSEDL